MVMIEISGFQPDSPKPPRREWLTPGFAAWFRRATTRPPPQPPPVAAASEEPRTAQIAFGVWGMSVWRSLKLRGVRERDLEDVVQDVFLVVFQRWDTFRGESSRKTWVFGIVHGIVANYHRKNRRAAAEPALVGDETWSNVADASAGDPASQSAARQELEWLRGVLNEFREVDRDLFVLHHIDGCSVSEAAQLVGMTASLANGRLIAAEKHINSALLRHQARDGWRLK